MNAIRKLRGQPESYERKAKYKLAETLGCGTYGVVRKAFHEEFGPVAIKIILKKNLKTSHNEKMAMDELDMLQRMNHPHIVRFVDWFESKDKFYIVTELATGGELFDRICDRGRFTEKDAAETIRQVLDAVDYLHSRNVVHRDLKPENLLYRAKEGEGKGSNELILADFGIAKMLDNKDEVLTTMCGSFGYAAPEVMLKQRHEKPVDMWSLGVTTYTLLCGYSPFRSDNLAELTEECQRGVVVFHDRYWRDVSDDAKDFILRLLRVAPEERMTSKQALNHVWLSGNVASDHNLLPELRAYTRRAQLRRAFELVKLANRIEALKAQDEDPTDSDISPDTIPSHVATEGIGLSTQGQIYPVPEKKIEQQPANRQKLTRKMRGAIFREIVLAKVKELKEQEENKKMQEAVESHNSGSSRSH